MVNVLEPICEEDHEVCIPPDITSAAGQKHARCYRCPDLSRVTGEERDGDEVGAHLCESRLCDGLEVNSGARVVAGPQ